MKIIPEYKRYHGDFFFFFALRTGYPRYICHACGNAVVFISDGAYVTFSPALEFVLANAALRKSTN